MTIAITTQEKLLSAAKELFWTRGYSNVSVRQITNLAGVDAALVSRYFGGKEGIFKATLQTIEPWDVLAAAPEDLLYTATAAFSKPYDPQTDQANSFSMLLANINDPQMGPFIQTMFQTNLADPLAAKIGGLDAEGRASMLLAALFGMALMRKNFQLSALTDAEPNDIAQRTHHIAKAALDYRS